MSLERVVAMIAHAAVFVDPEQGTPKDIMDLNDFVDCMEAHCNEVSFLFGGSSCVLSGVVWW